MLHTVLTILSIIGIVLLCVLAIILLLILLVLFVSIRYKINAVYHNNEYKVIAKASWLFGAIHYRISLEKDLIIKNFFVFGIQIKKKANSESKGYHKKKKKKIKKVIHVEEHIENSSTVEKDITKETIIEEPKIKVAEYNEVRKGPFEKKQKKKKQFRINFFKRIKDKIQNLLSQWKKIIEFIQNEDNKEVFIFTKLRFFELINHIKPKKIKGNIFLGFDDPAITGQVLGLLGLIFGFIGRGIQITPDFENKIIEIDIVIKGRIRAFNVLRIVWKCYRNKKFKKSFQQLMSLKD